MVGWCLQIAMGCNGVNIIGEYHWKKIGISLVNSLEYRNIFEYDLEIKVLRGSLFLSGRRVGVQIWVKQYLGTAEISWVLYGWNVIQACLLSGFTLWLICIVATFRSPRILPNTWQILDLLTNSTSNRCPKKSIPQKQSRGCPMMSAPRIEIDSANPLFERTAGHPGSSLDHRGRLYHSSRAQRRRRHCSRGGGTA